MPAEERVRIFVKPDISDKVVAKSPRLMDEVRSAIRVRHCSIRTEQAYVYWIAAFIRFNAMRHPRDLGAREVSAYLSYLATERDVAASTQQQALSALLFLYKQVLGVDLPWLQDLVRPKKPARLPTVLNQDEVARLLYGTGMRLMECLRLRVKDVDFVRREIVIREGKGAKDRVTVLLQRLVEPPLDAV